MRGLWVLWNKPLGTSTKGLNLMKMKEVNSFRGPVILNSKDRTLDLENWYIQRSLCTYEHDFWDANACNLHLEMLVMQMVLNHENCVMLMTFFPIFVILIWFFSFCGKHRLTIFFKDVITHATSSYFFCKYLWGLPQSVCFVWFNHFTILEWRQWSRLIFNQSKKILILGFAAFF